MSDDDEREMLAQNEKEWTEDSEGRSQSSSSKKPKSKKFTVLL